MYKTITSSTAEDFDRRLNDAEKDGFVLIHISVAMASYRERDYTAIMHKPDTAPSPFMTANDFLSAMDASVEIVQSMADHADEVLREEARQYGAGQ